MAEKSSAKAESGSSSWPGDQTSAIKASTKADASKATEYSSSITVTKKSTQTNDAGMTVTGWKEDPDRPKETLSENTQNLLRSNFVESLVMSGMASADDGIYYTNYNSLHNLPYFNPHNAQNIHIFITRPELNLSPGNFESSNELLQCTRTYEGCMLLASLVDPTLKNIDKGYAFVANNAGHIKYAGPGESYSYESAAKGNLDQEVAGYGPNASLGIQAFERMMTYGCNKVGMTPFIPLMSNLSNSISGMKDFNLEKYEYDGDQAGNKTADPTGLDESRSSGECTIEFTETSNISVTMMCYLWELYMDLVGKGVMVPTLETIEECKYDYMASIYWFVTGRDGLSIKLYGKMTGVYPTNVPITSLIPNKRGSPASSDVSIQFHYNHHEIMKPEILYDFNFTINRCMAQLNATNQSGRDIFLEKDPKYHNQYIEPWLVKNFYVPSRAISDNEDKNQTYQRFLATGVADNGKREYSNTIFYPNEQNQWLGQPYIHQGLLVYRSMSETDINVYNDKINADGIMPDSNISIEPDDSSMILNEAQFKVPSYVEEMGDRGGGGSDTTTPTSSNGKTSDENSYTVNGGNGITSEAAAAMDGNANRITYAQAYSQKLTETMNAMYPELQDIDPQNCSDKEYQQYMQAKAAASMVINEGMNPKTAKKKAKKLKF